MYKARFVFRNGKDATFISESYDKARSLLLRDYVLCGEELLYAEVFFQSIGYRYTIDLIDGRYRIDGRIISLEDLISMRSSDNPFGLDCNVDEIDADGGRLRVTVFDSSKESGWYGLERFL